MSMFRTCVTAALLGLAALAAPAAAQFSDAYNFIKAVKDKDAQKAKTILDQPGGGTLVNTRDGDSGDMALHIVTKRRDLGWIGFLLQNGADPNVRDRAGNTPLILAATTGFSEGVRVLLMLRPRVDLANRGGETALIKAVQSRDATSAKLLLDAGANPDLTDNAQGFSARQYAAQDARGGQVARLMRDAPARKPGASAQGPTL